MNAHAAHAPALRVSFYHPLTCRGMSSFKDIISRGQRQGCQPVTLNTYPLFFLLLSETHIHPPISHPAPTRFIAISCSAGCSNVAALRHSRAKAQTQLPRNPVLSLPPCRSVAGASQLAAGGCDKSSQMEHVS